MGVSSSGGDLEIRGVAHRDIRNVAILILALLVVVDDSVEVADDASCLQDVCFPLLPGDQLVDRGLDEGGATR